MTEKQISAVQKAFLFFSNFVSSFLRGIRPFAKTRKRPRSKFGWWLGLLIVMIGIFSYLTNPFVKFSLVNTDNNRITLVDSSFTLEQVESPILRDNAFSTQLAVIKHGWHIVASKFAGGEKTEVTSVDQIIRDIHALRFNPDLAFLISGDHFSMFYLRSLGIFYHSLLDPRTALDETDWKNRQLIYAKSLIYSLEVFSQSDRLTTTIVPIGPKSVALANFFAYPSDSLYSLLYAIEALQTDEINSIYNYQSLGQTYDLNTAILAEKLLEQYKPTLQRHYKNYIDMVVDSETGLIRKDLQLSSTKDSNIRESSFYDNIVLWRTKQLAMELGVIEDNQAELDTLKQKILDTFWLADEGYFLDHLSQKSIDQHYYSSDWLVAYMTGFLDPTDKVEQTYLIKSVEYVKRNALDRPFAIAYQPDLRKQELHFFPKYFAPTYASISLWSNWGMEYTKLMTSLAQATGDITYLNEAELQIAAYSYNIRRYRGYPEVYNYEGDFFRQPFYKSIRRTGWVVSFEQARSMLDWTKINWEEFTK